MPPLLKDKKEESTMRFFDRDYSKQEIMRRVGDLSQIGGVRSSILAGGRGEGVHVLDVRNGSGLNFSVVPSRGMDIAWTEWKGIPLAHIGKPGMSHPAFFEHDGSGFLRNFFCGLLTTCGLTYMGAACRDNGDELGVHGRVNNIPAEFMNASQEWEGNDLVMTVSGKVSESMFFKENMVLSRCIVTRSNKNILWIHDAVENQGFSEQPLMMLYHFNFGFPLVSENTRLYLPDNSSLTARDGEAKKGLDRYDSFSGPIHNFKEQVYYHSPATKENGETYACLYNHQMDLGVYLKYSITQLPHLIQWKMMGEGDYVVGLEPANAYPEGRAAMRARDMLQKISPGEIRSFDLEIGIIEDITELDSL